MRNDKGLGGTDKECLPSAPSVGPVIGHRHPVLDDPELDGLNLYEKKAFIVNRELDSYVSILEVSSNLTCETDRINLGHGQVPMVDFWSLRVWVRFRTLKNAVLYPNEDRYFLDLMWAQAFGLVATSLQNELGFPSPYLSDLMAETSTDTPLAEQLGNIFSSFSAGLTAGVRNLTCLLESHD